MSARDGGPVLRPVGDQALSVEFGRAIDPTSSSRVRALDAALAAAPFEGFRECVPAYASLLVVIDRARVSLEEASARVRERLTRAGPAADGGRHHVLPVVYGGERGPDLEEVAQQKGMSPAEVVRRHSAAEYTAFFVGFQPGFAYLGLLPAELETPRRGTPRARVPAGSVAIAGRQTGVYPSASPGGWHLIGRTAVRLFDPSLDPPALIHPGDRVRFEAVEELRASSEAPPHVAAANPGERAAAVEVMEAGLLTSIQDGGRRGLRRWGVPWCGPMDAFAQARANLALGNPPLAPALECTASGPTLRFLVPTWFAVDGAPFEPVLERADLGAWAVPAGVAVLARPGNVLSFRGRRAGFRSVVALRGGVDVPVVLGSRATDVLNALGGMEGRPLRAGDRLAVGSASALVPSAAAALPALSRAVTLRVVPGPQEEAFTPRAHETLLAEEYLLGALSDRTGSRLSGPPLTHVGAKEIVTDGMVPGCIQVPPDGQPIVMAADCPTTGGYPKIATVVTADLPLLAQLVPGEGRVRFALDESRQSTVNSQQ